MRGLQKRPFSVVSCTYIIYFLQLNSSSVSIDTCLYNIIYFIMHFCLFNCFNKIIFYLTLLIRNSSLLATDTISVLVVTKRASYEINHPSFELIPATKKHNHVGTDNCFSNMRIFKILFTAQGLSSVKFYFGDVPNRSFLLTPMKRNVFRPTE